MKTSEDVIRQLQEELDLLDRINLDWRRRHQSCAAALAVAGAIGASALCWAVVVSAIHWGWVHV